MQNSFGAGDAVTVLYPDGGGGYINHTCLIQKKI